MSQTPSHMALPPCLRAHFNAVLTLPPLLAGSSLIADQAWLEAFRQRAVLPHGLRYDGNTRLGFFYQWLWAQLIHHHPDYDLVAEEIQLHVEGKTLGAIDFLVANRRSGELEHWEVAIKFYLAWEKSWPGPNAKDNLDKKAHRMQSHQLLLSDTAAYHQQCVSRFGQPTVKRLIMQGRLFEPAHGEGSDEGSASAKNNRTIRDMGSAIATNPTAYRGHWCYAADSTDRALRAINKSAWIAPPPYASLSPSPELTNVTHPTMAVAPDERLWFVMPAHWPHDSA